MLHKNRIKSFADDYDFEKDEDRAQKWSSRTKPAKKCIGEKFTTISVGHGTVTYVNDPAADPQAWIEGFRDAANRFAKIAQTRRRQFEIISSLTQDVRQLQQKVAELSSQPFTVLITTLAPEPLVLARDISAVVAPNGEDFIATYFDAGISATGDTDTEAIFNLKDMIAQTFKVLSNVPAEELGIVPQRQLASLRAVITLPS
jgi:hypothetical protein